MKFATTIKKMMNNSVWKRWKIILHQMIIKVTMYDYRVVELEIK